MQEERRKPMDFVPLPMEKLQQRAGELVRELVKKPDIKLPLGLFLIGATGDWLYLRCEDHGEADHVEVNIVSGYPTDDDICIAIPVLAVFVDAEGTATAAMIYEDIAEWMNIVSQSVPGFVN